MTCERAQPLISALIDGEVTAAERERVLAHLRTCVACTAVYEDYRRLRARIRDLAPVEPPVHLAPSVWERIDSERRAPNRWRGRARAVVGGVAAMAAALLVAVALSASDGEATDRVSLLLGRPPVVASATLAPQRQVVEPASPPTSTPRPPATATATPPPASPTSRPAPPPTAAPAAVPAATVTIVDEEPPATATPRPIVTARVATATPRPAPPPTATTVPPTRPPATAPPTTATAKPVATAPATRPSPSPPTRMPATATATRVLPTPTPAPTATATRPAAPVVGASFAAAYAGNAGVRARLGAPLLAERGVEGLTQPFERGQMESFADARQIIVLYRDGNSWARFTDTWSPDEVATPGDPPPPGLHRPRRGFGKLWRENITVRERLGWATAPDLGYVAKVQRFERGQMVSSNGAIYALFEDGAWERLD
ncbi:MAG: zf-HC2 domain-containing protein [Chloroflexi bacterium]|nr:zf-HC2 domain-containing protein [Chloroflexota bacterium]